MHTRHSHSHFPGPTLMSRQTWRKWHAQTPSSAFNLSAKVNQGSIFPCLAPCIRAVEISRYMISRNVRHHCDILRLWGGFHLTAIIFFAAVKPARKILFWIKLGNPIEDRSFRINIEGINWMLSPIIDDSVLVIWCQKVTTGLQSHTMCKKVPIELSVHNVQRGLSRNFMWQSLRGVR